MFIKKVVKTYKGNGNTYTEYRFVRGYRTSVGPRHQTLLTVRDIPLPEDKWKQLTDAMDCILNCEEVVFVESSVMNLAEYYCHLIRARHPDLNTKRKSDLPPGQTDDLVYAESIQVYNDRSFGAEYVGHWMYERLGFDDLFRKLGYSEHQRMLISLSIIGRLVNPVSENAMHIWAKDLSAIGELVGWDLTRLGHNSLYRISDIIFKHKDEIETYLCDRERDIFHLQENLCLYDLTNTFFEGKAAGISKAKHGRSKEKRSDCRLITLGMVVDELGFSKRSNILDGSVSEPHTFIEMIESLSMNMNRSHKPVVIMDAGISTIKNLDYLKEKELDYLCVSRTNPLPAEEVSLEGMIEVYKDKENLVTAKIYQLDNEVLLFCHSKKMEFKERAIQDSFCKKFEDGLSNIISALTKRYSNKSYGKIQERIGRLRERYPFVSRFYHIDVKESNGQAVSIDFHKIKQQEEDLRFSGTYWLRTSILEWNERKIWETYMMLNRIESAFRSLKHELAFRPIYHQTGLRAEAHIFIAVLAYHLLNAIGHELRSNGITTSWNTVRSTLSNHRRVTVTGLTTHKKMYSKRITSKADPSHLSIYNALNLNPNPRLKPIKYGKM